ncbi:MAG TPA: glycine betaine ABC transporter substrate-binding protein, partial [Nocardioides sp.]|nr:glycine betaine ABC transporter substrate-binding protein [Nocardioides sp.]
MSIRRSLAAVLSVGTLFLATACAGDDLDSGSSTADDTASSSPTTSESGGGSAGGPLTLAGQNFPEATLVASMYTQLLEKAGYDVTQKLVDTRDGYMADFPGGVDVVPEYVGGIVNFLNSQKNGDNATPFDAGDGAQLAQQGQPLLDAAGITLLDQSAATDTNAFMVTKDYS